MGRKSKRAHRLMYAPYIETAGLATGAPVRYVSLAWYRRPVLTGVDSAELVEPPTGLSDAIVVTPPHAWTPFL